MTSSFQTLYLVFKHIMSILKKGKNGRDISSNSPKKIIISEDDWRGVVGRVSDKNNIAWKKTYAETVANYVAPRVAPHIAIAPHV